MERQAILDKAFESLRDRGPRPVKPSELEAKLHRASQEFNVSPRLELTDFKDTLRERKHILTDRLNLHPYTVTEERPEYERQWTGGRRSFASAMSGSHSDPDNYSKVRVGTKEVELTEWSHSLPELRQSYHGLGLINPQKSVDLLAAMQDGAHNHQKFANKAIEHIVPDEPQDTLNDRAAKIIEDGLLPDTTSYLQLLHEHAIKGDLRLPVEDCVTNLRGELREENGEEARYSEAVHVIADHPGRGKAIRDACSKGRVADDVAAQLFTNKDIISPDDLTSYVAGSQYHWSPKPSAVREQASSIKRLDDTPDPVATIVNSYFRGLTTFDASNAASTYRPEEIMKNPDENAFLNCLLEVDAAHEGDTQIIRVGGDVAGGDNSGARAGAALQIFDSLGRSQSAVKLIHDTESRFIERGHSRTSLGSRIIEDAIKSLEDDPDKQVNLLSYLKGSHDNSVAQSVSPETLRAVTENRAGRTTLKNRAHQTKPYPHKRTSIVEYLDDVHAHLDRWGLSHASNESIQAFYDDVKAESYKLFFEDLMHHVTEDDTVQRLTTTYQRLQESDYTAAPWTRRIQEARRNLLRKNKKKRGELPAHKFLWQADRDGSIDSVTIDQPGNIELVERRSELREPTTYSLIEDGHNLRVDALREYQKTGLKQGESIGWKYASNPAKGFKEQVKTYVEQHTAFYDIVAQSDWQPSSAFSDNKAWIQSHYRRFADEDRLDDLFAT